MFAGVPSVTFEERRRSVAGVKTKEPAPAGSGGFRNHGTPFDQRAIKCGVVMLKVAGRYSGDELDAALKLARRAIECLTAARTI